MDFIWKGRLSPGVLGASLEREKPALKDPRFGPAPAPVFKIYLRWFGLGHESSTGLVIWSETVEELFSPPEALATFIQKQIQAKRF